MRSKYATVKIPMELAAKLDKYVSDMGYRSRAEIVNDAIRRFIDQRVQLNASTFSQNQKIPDNESNRSMRILR
jgi:metal-responsive CopG/Arc/MetJ family transcriptional regulator